MAVDAEVMDILNQIVRTPEDEVAFNAGLRLSSERRLNGRIGGHVIPRSYGRAHVALDMEASELKEAWPDGSSRPDGIGISIDNPAFFVGAAIAAVRYQLAESQPQV